MKTMYRLHQRLAPVLMLALLSAPTAFAAEHADPLQIDVAAQRAAGIVLAKAEPRMLADELKAPGEVQANAYATVLVSPRVASQVLSRKARLGDEVTVKRLHRAGPRVELLPENPEFEAIVVSGRGGQDFAIEGLAVGLIRNNMML